MKVWASNHKHLPGFLPPDHIVPSALFPQGKPGSETPEKPTGRETGHATWIINKKWKVTALDQRMWGDIIAGAVIVAYEQLLGGVITSSSDVLFVLSLIFNVSPSLS